MDLLGGIGLGSTPATAPTPAAAPRGGADLLGDLFGSGPALSPSPAALTSANSFASPSVAADPLGDLLGGFGGGGGGGAQAAAKSYTCYDKNGLRISFIPTKENAIEGVSLRIEAKLENVGMGQIGGVAFQVAVPKVGFIVWLCVFVLFVGLSRVASTVVCVLP